ncbi:MAG TPA: GNAT family N-acetyltransferase [Blastocatellia bacterium]|jgi:GNAT superfamily N-acetyltransferase
MEVAESARWEGFGSYLAQDLKRYCYEAGKKPAARCNSDGTGSRRTLEKAGFLTCGRLLAGETVT